MVVCLLWAACRRVISGRQVRGTIRAELALCEKVRINYLLLENVTESRCVENVLPVYPSADLVNSLTSVRSVRPRHSMRALSLLKLVNHWGSGDTGRSCEAMLLVATTGYHPGLTACLRPTRAFCPSRNRRIDSVLCDRPPAIASRVRAVMFGLGLQPPWFNSQQYGM